MTTTPKKKTFQTNDWSEILSHVINGMNSVEQFEEVEMRIF